MEQPKDMRKRRTHNDTGPLLMSNTVNSTICRLGSPGILYWLNLPNQSDR